MYFNALKVGDKFCFHNDRKKRNVFKKIRKGKEVLAEAKSGRAFKVKPKTFVLKIGAKQKQGRSDKLNQDIDKALQRLGEAERILKTAGQYVNKFDPDPVYGAMLLRLSDGVRLNYVTLNTVQAGIDQYELTKRQNG